MCIATAVVVSCAVIIGAAWQTRRLRSFAPSHEVIPFDAKEPEHAAQLGQFVAGLDDGAIIAITADRPTVNFASSFYLTLASDDMRYRSLQMAWRWSVANHSTFGESEADRMVIEIDGHRVGVSHQPSASSPNEVSTQTGWNFPRR